MALRCASIWNMMYKTTCRIAQPLFLLHWTMLTLTKVLTLRLTLTVLTLTVLKMVLMLTITTVLAMTLALTFTMVLVLTMMLTLAMVPAVATLFRCASSSRWWLLFAGVFRI